MPQVNADSFAHTLSSRDSRQLRDQATMPYYELECIRDGTVAVFFHDGPFPFDPITKTPVNGWQSKPPGGRTQQLIRKLMQRDENGLAIWAAKPAEDGRPIPGPWNRDLQRQQPVPVIDAEWKAAQAKHMAARNARANETVRRREADQLKEQETAAASESRITNALAGMIEKAVSGATKKSAKKEAGDAAQ